MGLCARLSHKKRKNQDGNHLPVKSAGVVTTALSSFIWDGLHRAVLLLYRTLAFLSSRKACLCSSCLWSPLIVFSDCHFIHKIPASTWGAVLLTAPPRPNSHVEVLKELLDLVMGGFKLHSRPLSCYVCLCALWLFTLLPFSKLWKEAFWTPVWLWRAALTKKPHRCINVLGWCTKNNMLCFCRTWSCKFTLKV